MAPIDRRVLLKALPLGGVAWLLGTSRGKRSRLERPEIEIEPFDPPTDEGAAPPHHDHSGDPVSARQLQKIRDFDRPYAEDIFMPEARLETFFSLSARLRRAQRIIGHGHFNLLSFDDLRTFARRYPRIGKLPQGEVDMLEELFHTEATRYGFRGKKVITEVTDRIDPRDVESVRGTGHYLLKGDSLDKYQRIRADLGETIFLTSGVRSVVKQFELFLSKAVRCGGNLSQASRSLAPPGYSYHGVGDFDLGRVGFGLKNFSEEFANTDEYRKLIDLGYVSIRYTETNPFGVRHEPWHIKITT